VTGSEMQSLLLFVVYFVVVYFIKSIIAIQYNIILYNIQNRKTEKVKVEANAYIFLS